MDSIVAMGNRVPHMGPEYYLPLANCDNAEALRARLSNDVCHSAPIVSPFNALNTPNSYSKVVQV